VLLAVMWFNYLKKTLRIELNKLVKFSKHSGCKKITPQKEKGDSGISTPTK
jgi:hypothetical protein